jgi:hypothetical protein
MELAHLEKLADELIELRCDTHSVGNVYDYLLRAYDGDANRAKADFMLYLSGDLPTRVLQAAAEWVTEEQEPDWRPPSYNGQTVGGYADKTASTT